MDLTEFRFKIHPKMKRSRLGWLGRHRRLGVGEGVRWPSTVTPWRLASCDALDVTLQLVYRMLHVTLQQTLNPNP